MAGQTGFGEGRCPAYSAAEIRHAYATADGNAVIDGVMPLLRLLDAAAAAEPVLMWLAWAMTATALAALPSLASRVPSLLLSLLLTVPGSALLGLSVSIFSLLLGDTGRLHPFPNLALALAVSSAPLLIGWRYAGALPRHMQSAEVTLRLARPVLVTTVLLVALTLHPFTPVAAIPPLLGAAVFITEVILTRLTLGALKRSSTSRPSADLSTVRMRGARVRRARPQHGLRRGRRRTHARLVGRVPATARRGRPAERRSRRGRPRDAHPRA